MQKRTLKVAILAALTIVLVFSMSAAAFAQPSQYSDLNGATVGPYKVTLEQVSAISDVAAGKFRPFDNITRAEFAVMAVKAFDIPLVSPATPSFPDVPATHALYQYIEAAAKAGIIQGYTDGKFGPKDTATRQQMLSIIARYVGGKAGYYAAGVWNFRTPAEIDALVAHFGDAATIDPAHKTAMAFAYAMGITLGDAKGNLAPLTKLTRIQGAAMLIRSQALVPFNAAYPADVALVSADKSENLIGQTHTLKFKVTDANGHPAKGALVDFDTAFANPLYVGNISPQAAVADAFGEVTVNLYSAEPGTQRLTATVQTITGPATAVATKYWLAMDEIYILDEALEAENNAGDAHEWCARVVVLGPGPRSTSQFDWYNVIDASFNPADLQQDDGRFATVDDYNEELAELALDESMRTLPGIGVQWNIVNVQNDIPTTTADETIPSVGKITELDGDAIAPATSALGMTDDEGVSCITILSEATGKTVVQAWATYPENPYPQMLIDRSTVDPAYWEADDDWEQQPKSAARAVKTWIPHVIDGDSDAPITPAYAVNNTGEVETFTLTLKDTFGNVIPGYTVEWWIQGVGFFKTDATTWVGIGEQNKDVDVTDSKGQATLDLKSLVPGQTIVHCKVMDKYGLPYKEWNVVKQWYSVDDVTFGLFDEDDEFYAEDQATNLVNTGHTWYLAVSGAKYVYTIYDLNKNGLRDDKVLIGDRADMKAKAGVYANFDGTVGASKAANVDPAVGVPFMASTGDTWYIRFADMDLEDNEFWTDMIGTVTGAEQRLVDDGIDEVWAGLEGKDVYFYNNQYFDGLRDSPASGLVGTITSATKVKTDAMGFAQVDINSTNKGNQNVIGVVDYPENPQDGDPLKPTKFAELRYDIAYKLWTADYDSDEAVKIFASGILGEANGYRWTNPILAWDVPGTAAVTIAAPPAGTAPAVTATVAAGGAVTGSTGLPGGTNYTAADVGRAVTAALPVGSGAAATAYLQSGGPTDNGVDYIQVTNGGTGYTVAPTVTIEAPAIAGGTTATATANISGGSVVSITVNNAGSGYTAAQLPLDVTFTSNAGAAVTVGTIATVVNNQVETITWAFPAATAAGPYAVAVPAPLKTQATATATVAGGVVTGLSLTNAGTGYIDAPAVTISGNGTGAVAYATVNANSSIALTLLSGGSGYFNVTVDPTTEKSANPNRETLCVSVFDKYGNALQGYKVTFEVVGQGTTTAGTIPTYHPYAHFEDPEHDIDLSGTANDKWAGLGDLNPYVNANPYWNLSPDLVPGNPTEELSDSDYAWGYTLNHEINYITNPDYAATVDLVMDETRAQLTGKQHITNIVNIQVFDPNGVRIMEKEVTKVWSLEQPTLTTIQTMVSTTGAEGTWTTAIPATSIQPIHYRVQLFDQYGNPFTGSVPNLKLRYGSAAWTYQVAPLATPDADGVIYGTQTAAIPGVWNFQAWNDSVTTDSLVSPNELASNLATYTVQ